MAEDENKLEFDIGVRIEQLDPDANMEEAMSAIRAQYGGLLDDVQKLKEEYGSVAEAIETMAQAYVLTAKDTASASEDQIKNLEGVRKGLANIIKEASKMKKALKDDGDDGKAKTGKMKAFSKEQGKLNKGARELEMGFRKAWKSASFFVMPPSFVAAIKMTIDYKKALLGASAGISRLGIGLSSLMGTLERTANVVALTRMETVKLFDQYQKGMRFVSLQGFESMLTRIKGIVGANDVAIQDMQGAIISLSGSFPNLARELQNINSLDKNLVANKIENLYWAGKLEEGQYRTIQAYISGNEQVFGQDKQRQKMMQQQIKTMQEFKRQAEKIAHIFVEMFLPYLKKITDFLEDLQNGTSNWTKLVGQLAAAFLTLKGVMFLSKGKSFTTLAGIVTEKSAASALVAGASAEAAGTVATGGLGTAGAAGFLTSVPGVLAAVGIGAGVAAMHYGGKYSEKYAEEGRFEASGKAQVAGGLGAIAAGAGTGALIGSIFPVVGTAFGTVAGAAVGLAYSFGDLKEGIDKIVRTEEYEKKMEAEKLAAEKYDKAVADAEAKATRSSKLQGEIEKSIEKDKAADLNATRKLLAKKQKTEEKNLKKAELKVFSKAADIAGRKMTEGDETGKVYAFEGGEKFKEGLEEDRRKLAIRENVLAVQKNSLGRAKKKAIQEEIIALNKQIEIKEKALNLAGEENEEYKDAHDALLKIKGRQEAIRISIKTQREILEGINALYKAQTGHLNAMVASMAASGRIDEGALLSQTESNIESLKEERKELAQIQNIFAKGDVSQAGVLLNSKAITEETKKTLREKIANHHLDVNALAALEDRENIGRQIHENALALNTEGLVAVKAYDGIIKAMDLQVARATTLVEIADNYAIGVGASAKMRMDVYEAEGRKIKELENQLRLNANERDKAAADGRDTLQFDNQRLEIQNKILDATLRQNQAVKAMRDGWVYAISAMNTGAGGFSEIIMNAEQNTAQMQRLEGSVRSSTSGGIARRGRRGIIIEDIGFRGSQRFGIGGTGDIIGREGEPELSYTTEVDDRLGIKRRGPSFLQYDARRTAEERYEETVGTLKSQGEIVGQGTGQALGAGANKYILSSIAAGSQAQVDAAMGIEESAKDISSAVKAPKRVKEEATPKAIGTKKEEDKKKVIKHSAAVDDSLMTKEEVELKAIIQEVDVSGLDPIVLKVIPDFIGLEEIILTSKVNLGSVTPENKIITSKAFTGAIKPIAGSSNTKTVNTKVIEKNTSQTMKLEDATRISASEVIVAKGMVPGEPGYEIPEFENINKEQFVKLTQVLSTKQKGKLGYEIPEFENINKEQFVKLTQVTKG